MLKFCSPYLSTWISLWYTPILLNYLTFFSITRTFTSLQSFILFYIFPSLTLTLSFHFGTILQRSLAPIFIHAKHILKPLERPLPKSSNCSVLPIN
jgi:hypothetical protein